MKRQFMALVLLVLLLTGCSQGSGTQNGSKAALEESPIVGSTEDSTSEKCQTTVFAMDTVMDLTVYGDREILEEAEDMIKELESLFSATDSASEVYKLNHTGSYTLSEDTGSLLESTLALCERTGGALDISIYPIVRSWGFTTGDYNVPSEDTLLELLKNVDYSKISYDAGSRAAALPQGMEIDFGSVAKGYTGDRLTGLFQENGIQSALLNLGGNVQALGGKPDGSPWRVGIEDPATDDYFGILEITDKAVITSGGYERYFEEDGNIYWHIIDPETGRPAHSGLLSVTIVGDSGLLCDGLSTSLFVMGLDEASAFWKLSGDFEAVFVDEDGRIIITEGLESCFTLADSYQGAELKVLRRD